MIWLSWRLCAVHDTPVVRSIRPEKATTTNPASNAISDMAAPKAYSLQGRAA